MHFHTHALHSTNTNLCIWIESRFLSAKYLSLCRTGYMIFEYVALIDSDFACWNDIVLGQSQLSGFGTVSHGLPHPSITFPTHSYTNRAEEKILCSKPAQIFCDHQHWSVKTRTGNVRAGGRNVQTSALSKPCLHPLLLARGWGRAAATIRAVRAQEAVPAPRLPSGISGGGGG